MDDQYSLSKRHSFSMAQCSEPPEVCNSRELCKSDINVSTKNASKSMKMSNLVTSKFANENRDLNEIPSTDHSYTENQNSGDDKTYSITNSDIDKLEIKILSTMSQELQTEGSVASLESNIKLFKATVQQIFDNFHSNMEDFEIYKKKFNDILEKNKGDRIAMENFIRDMLKHISSTDSSLSHSNKLNTNNRSDETFNKEYLSGDNAVETFKNDNYFTDSTFDENSSKFNSSANKETINIYLLNETPYIHIKMNDRNLFSEINIRDQCIDSIKEMASTENVKKLAAKNMELKKYVKEQKKSLQDRDIPIKNSCAKKNIHMNEDFNDDKDDSNKFFIFKICDYICRKIRKNTFG